MVNGETEQRRQMMREFLEKLRIAYAEYLERKGAKVGDISVRIVRGKT